MLNEDERKKYNTIEKLINRKITRKEASAELKISLRQVDRLKLIYYSYGEGGFIHKNRGKESKNKLDETIIKQLENLYLSEYYDYNFEAFYEEITTKHNYNISYQFILKRFKEDDIISPLAHKKTIKEYKEKINTVIRKNNSNDNTRDEKVELYKSRIIETEKAHTRRSSNLYAFGQEVQMDACGKYWFGGVVSYLHLAVDKATKKVLFGWFEFEEITRGYFVLLFHIIINYGIPAKIKADNRSSFTANNAKDKQKALTQFGKACEKLDIVLHTTSVSTAKANVERENETFKNRLIAELRHEGITTIDEANDYLNNVFIPKMNQKFSYVIDKKTSLIRENIYTEEELKLIISERKEKVIDNASAISDNYKYYIPINPESGEMICFAKGTKCILIINYDGEYWAEIENHYYQILELENRDSTMTKESEATDSKIKKEHHKYIPPKNHPWRKNMMLKN